MTVAVAALYERRFSIERRHRPPLQIRSTSQRVKDWLGIDAEQECARDEGD